MALTLFSLAFLSFVSTFPHILSTLLNLEFMSLALYFALVNLSAFSHQTLFQAFLFLAVAVSEGALGLSLVILFARAHGSDRLSLSLLY